MHNFWRLTSIVLIALYLFAPAIAREQVRVVGSTASYPFATAVAERLGKTTNFKTPIIEATGTGGGIRIFCGGSDENYPDMVNASRPMSEEEKRLCRQNGVDDLIEFKIGYDGIVLGTSINQDVFPISRVNLSKALAEKIEVDGKLVDNSNKSWKDVDASLPDVPIVVLGPTSTLATREIFENLVILKGCMEYASNPKTCNKNIREDGPFIEVAEHENVVVQKIGLRQNSLGFVSYGFYYQNPEKIKALPLDGVMPTLETISNQSYPLVRPLYLYVKKSRIDVMPSLKAFLEEYFSDQASGKNGYLVDIGLIPLTEPERQSGALSNF